MTIRRSTARPFVRGKKRKVVWIGPANQNFVSIANGTKVLMATFDPDASGLVSPTLARTRGNVGVSAESYASDQDFVGAIGMGVVSDRAVAAGVASIPGPWTDANWGGWFVWRTFSYHFDYATEAAKVQVNWGFEVDSKAMRKIGVDETLVIVGESETGAFQLFDGTRHLMMLS